MEIYCKEIGKISITSGEIISCDPFIGLEDLPFTKNVQLGEHDVFINVIHDKESDNEIVAYAILKFSDKEIVKRETATIEGQNVEKLKGDEFFGYFINTGMGGFFDRNSIL